MSDPRDAVVQAALELTNWLYGLRADDILTGPVVEMAGVLREALAALDATDNNATTTLAECPIGLFISASGDLCLKTEYGSNEGRIDAYIVASGEFFWGAAPQTIKHQRRQLVRPVTDEKVDAFVRTLA